jgi:hypothetical protein
LAGFRRFGRLRGRGVRVPIRAAGNVQRVTDWRRVGADESGDSIAKCTLRGANLVRVALSAIGRFAEVR